jgi:hypothetical protein
MQRTLTDNARAFLALNPARVAMVAGHTFYEHPTLGDESPLVCITRDGRKKTSPFWEAPELMEVLDEYG